MYYTEDDDTCCTNPRHCLLSLTDFHCVNAKMLSAALQLVAALVVLVSRADLAIVLSTGGSREGSCREGPFCHHSFGHQVPNTRQAAAARIQVLPYSPHDACALSSSAIHWLQLMSTAVHQIMSFVGLGVESLSVPAAC